MLGDSTAIKVFALQTVHGKRRKAEQLGCVDLAPTSEAFVRHPVLFLGEFRRKILALLQNAEEERGEQVRCLPRRSCSSGDPQSSASF